MRLVDARVAAVAAPFPRPLWPTPRPITTNTAVVVHLEDEDGRLGLGYLPTFGFGTFAVRSLVADDLTPRLLGRDWADAAEAVRELVASTALAGRLAGAARMAIAALECALLDLESKRAGLPLHRLWGLPTTPTRAYASGGWRYLPADDVVAHARAAVERGFTAVKIQVGLSPAEDAGRLRAVREAVGPEVAVMVDANERIPATDAAAWLRGLEQFEPTWIEEPVPAADHATLATLTAGSAAPIAAGEGETEPAELVDLVERRAVDVLQPDVYRVGFGALRDLATATADADLAFAPHMAHELSGHVTTGSSGTTWLEYFDWFEDWWEEPVMPVAGEIAPPSRHGHGLSVPAAWLAAHRI